MQKQKERDRMRFNSLLCSFHSLLEFFVGFLKMRDQVIIQSLSSLLNNSVSLHLYLSSQKLVFLFDVALFGRHPRVLGRQTCECE